MGYNKILVDSYYCRRCHRIHKARYWIHTQHLSWRSTIIIDGTMVDDRAGYFDGELEGSYG